MEFYQKKELMMILEYLKKYIFVSYQFLVLKYYLKLSNEDLKIATNIEKTEYIDNSIIEYIYQKNYVRRLKMAEIKTIYNAINEDKTMKRYVDLRDIKIESRDDLLKTCQVFRNPRFETF